MKKKIFLTLVTGGIFSALKAKAVCPVCAVAVGAGVGFTRWLGIDDTITGLWVGALTVTIIMWTIDWMDRKDYRFKGRKIMITIIWFLLVIPPLYWMGVMGHPLNTIWGVDKLLLSIIIGSLAFFFTQLWYNQLKKKNDGRAHFPYQKVVMPVAVLIVLSGVFYLLTK